MKTNRTLFLAVVLALAGGPATSSRAFADAKADEAEQKEVTKEERSAAETAGLTRYDLGIWTLIVFGALVFVLGKFAWKPIMNGLQKREDNIAAHHADAEKARAEAEKLLIEVKAQRAKAHEEMAAIVAAARRDADVFREAEKARTAGDIQAERDRLKREIETARDQALSEIWDKTAQLAALVSSKAIGRVVTADDHRRFIDESLAELNQRVTGSQA